MAIRNARRGPPGERSRSDIVEGLLIAGLVLVVIAQCVLMVLGVRGL